MPAEKALAAGMIEHAGTPDAPGLIAQLTQHGSPDAVAHRVAHGGTEFSAAVRIDDAVLARIRGLVPLAPLHNPANLAGIEAAMAAFPHAPQVAVFDTAFHQSIPEHAWRYAVPETWWRDYGVRRYGFHGSSVRYAAETAARCLGREPGDLALVVLHLGNGASATAVQNGRSIDTSMGMSTLEGLVMGTRCGDLDPAVPGYLAREAGLAPAEIDRLLHAESGLLALCGDSDMREIGRRAEAGDERAVLALEVFCHRARRHVGALAATLGRLDALVFTGGIGEHRADVRARICAGLEVMGVRLDAARNAEAGPLPAQVQAHDSRATVLVVAADEALQIARETARLLGA
ncbi:acetate/propionate family kinase [Thioalkalivibrio sp. XN279]|nr:acetate/propionate family kinase [Thioalkalivibrio sp. XN279]NHA15583.1 acetate/propionate family kinase [Thioalkalivibrio sp. XN279]